jgi:tetratricopeptide (TPR) repeat protein
MLNRPPTPTTLNRSSPGLQRHPERVSVSQFSLMMFHARSSLIALFLWPCGLLFSAAPPDPGDTLKELVTQQNALFAEAEKHEANFDEQNFHSQLQQICNAYDLLLRDHPKLASAYVAYGMLLSKVEMRKEAATMFIRANLIDKDIPLVKNQLGNYLAEEGKPLEAVNYYLSAIQLAPKEPLYHYQLGTLLTEARQDFLISGEWTREALDKAMHEAFRQAMELSPGSLPHAYRYGESFYDLENPDWDEALEFWRGLELKAATGVEKQTIRLHQANVLIKQKKFTEARDLIDSVTEQPLEGQKQKLIALLPGAKTK